MDALYLTKSIQIEWMQTIDKYWYKGDTHYSVRFDLWPEWLFKYYDELPLGESIESADLMWNPEQHRLTPKYYIMRALVTLVKHYHVNFYNHNKKFKITYQCCNGFVTCSVRS